MSEIFLLVLDFLAESLKANKISELHFTKQFHHKNFTHFSNLSSLNIVKNILPQPSQTPFSFYKFSSKIFFGQKNVLHCTNSRCPTTAFGIHLEKHLFYLLWSSFYSIRYCALNIAFIYLYICSSLFLVLY